ARAGLDLVFERALDARLSFFAVRVRAACEDIRSDLAVKEVLPEPPPIARVLDTLFDDFAQRARELREDSESLRQKRFESLANSTRQHRRIAAAADRDDDRRTIHDGRHDETRQLAIVDDVDGHVSTVSLMRDPRVDGMLIRRGDREAHAFE